MRISFRQGIVRQQTDITNTPTFLQHTASGVSIRVSPDETIIAFAHGFDADYIFIEQQPVTDAWPGPFTPNVDYWLYWNIDPITGYRTFGQTTVEPIDGPTEPASPQEDQHWFDTTTSIMRVRNSNRWREVIRCFAGKLDEGAVLIQFTTGTQVGFETTVYAGTLLFDDENNAIKKFDRLGRGKFITTESPLASQSNKLANFRLEGLNTPVRAIEFIPKSFCVAYHTATEIGLASFATPNMPAVGIAVEDMAIGDVRSVIRSGEISDNSWNWTGPTGTRLFVGVTGEITTNVPQTSSIQQIGTVISPTSVLINIHPIIRLS